jgi:hypothetical protein
MKTVRSVCLTFGVCATLGLGLGGHARAIDRGIDVQRVITGAGAFDTAGGDAIDQVRQSRPLTFADAAGMQGVLPAADGLSMYRDEALWIAKPVQRSEPVLSMYGDERVWLIRPHQISAPIGEYTTPVPEPSTVALMLAGVIALLVWRRRQRG